MRRSRTAGPHVIRVPVAAAHGRTLRREHVERERNALPVGRARHGGERETRDGVAGELPGVVAVDRVPRSKRQSGTADPPKRPSSSAGARARHPRRDRARRGPPRPCTSAPTRGRAPRRPARGRARRAVRAGDRTPPSLPGPFVLLGRAAGLRACGCAGRILHLFALLALAVGALSVVVAALRALFFEVELRLLDVDARLSSVRAARRALSSS